MFLAPRGTDTGDARNAAAGDWARRIGATDLDARLWEISENLHRAELSPEERTFQLGEYVRLTERKVEGADKLPHRGAVSGGRGNEGGVRAAARDLGLSETQARRAAKAYDLPEDVKAAAVEQGIGALILSRSVTTITESGLASQAGRHNRCNRRENMTMAWFHITDPSGSAIVDSGRILAALPDGKLRVAFKDADGLEHGTRIIDPAELEPCRLQVFDTWREWRAAA